MLKASHSSPAKSDFIEEEVAPASSLNHSAMASISKAAFSHNIFWLITSTGLTSGLNAMINFLLARKLGVERFGQWSLILASTSWISVWQIAVGSDLIRKSAKDSQYGKRFYTLSLTILILGVCVLGFGSLGLNFVLVRASSILLPGALIALAA